VLWKNNKTQKLYFFFANIINCNATSVFTRALHSGIYSVTDIFPLTVATTVSLFINNLSAKISHFSCHGTSCSIRC
jgi:hypothetical protein